MYIKALFRSILLCSHPQIIAQCIAQWGLPLLEVSELLYGIKGYVFKNKNSWTQDKVEKNWVGDPMYTL
jgi:hypothetical protein